MFKPTKKKNATKKKNEGGYSLIETMFAMVFLSIGLLAMAQTIPAANSHMTTSRNRSAAIQEVQSQIEELISLPYNSSELTAGSHYSTQGNRTISYTVTDNDPVPNTKKVVMTISWTEATGTKQMNYSTIIAQ
ncbi:MAG: hypothetical protein HKN21_11535 [Candidatus Eisenbacteria bacterium]|uniref:Type II secretion system protein n=1 Tax=Eiseniibacteriota bacterium TaxID=2212470 RepID=A0A7Y2H2R5_UNCEI|nr:hypothetical protein [Candidatus Eisenbacteria bacterium]